MSEPVIEVRHLSKSFGTHVVLRDVDFTVNAGDVTCIIGASGSGKSTMGRVLCGLLKPDSGEAILDGVSVYASRAGRRNLQNKLSVVFQDYTTSANPRFRVKDIIGEGLTVRERRERDGWSETKKQPPFWSWWDFLLILRTDFPTNSPVASFSGCASPGRWPVSQRSSSLMRRSPPDAHTQVQVMDLLRDLKEKLGLTYVFITHDLTSITYLCDDVLFLYQGRVTEYLPVSRISETKDEYARRLLESIVVFDTETSEVDV